MGLNDNPIRLDLNNPVFQEHLFGLQKPERNAVMDTLRKIRQLNWSQLLAAHYPVPSLYCIPRGRFHAVAVSGS